MSTSPVRLDQVLDIVTIKALALVGQTASVTKTAERLGYSQPAISQRLSRTEEKLGLQLIRRQGNSVMLTEAGEVLAGISGRIEEALEDARLGLADLTTLRSGSFTLSGFPSVSATLVPIILSNLRVARPGLQVSYIEAEPPEALQLLRDRRIDAAITCTYPGEGGHFGSTLHQLPLFSDPLFVIMPTSHRLAGDPTVALEELSADEWVAGCPLCRGYVMTACDDHGFTPRITLETDNFAAVVGLVSRGLGVSIVPALVLRTVAIPASVAVRRLSQPANRSIELITDQAVTQSPVLHAMARLFRALDANAWGLESARPSGRAGAQGQG
ncbi:MAG: LysR family transcriptional regulator [Microbacterium sp.]